MNRAAALSPSICQQPYRFLLIGIIDAQYRRVCWAQLDSSSTVVRLASSENALAKAGSEQLGRRGSVQWAGADGKDAANEGAVPQIRLQIKVRPQAERVATSAIGSTDADDACVAAWTERFIKIGQVSMQAAWAGEISRGQKLLADDGDADSAPRSKDALPQDVTEAQWLAARVPHAPNLAVQGGPTLEPNATLDEHPGRAESLGSQRDGAAPWHSEDGRPADSATPRRVSAYDLAASQGRDRGLLMLHEVRTAPLYGRTSSCAWPNEGLGMSLACRVSAFSALHFSAQCTITASFVSLHRLNASPRKATLAPNCRAPSRVCSSHSSGCPSRLTRSRRPLPRRARGRCRAA